MLCLGRQVQQEDGAIVQHACLGYSPHVCINASHCSQQAHAWHTWCMAHGTCERGARYVMHGSWYVVHDLW